jgi:large subunit ribosomal protein L9
MKVLFLQNLEHNKVGDIKDVPNGYARNFLLKKGIAVIATAEKVAEMEAKIEKMKNDEEKMAAALTNEAEKVENLKLVISAQAGDEGKLFGAITNRDLAEALEKKKFTIEKQDIEILNPVHELGEHEALVKLGHGIHATLHFKVERA